MQTTLLVEYNTTPHRILCGTFYKKRVNLTLKLNVSGLNDVHLDIMWAKMIMYRARARHVLMILDNILKRGSKTEEEKGISLSYLYLASIDGVYGKNLKDILIFDMLANCSKINYKQIERMKLDEIQKYFKKIPDSDCLFDGWDEDIRNAIAHSSFWYDAQNSKFIYEERRKNHIKTKTSQEILEMLAKLADLDELVLLYNQVFRINKIIMDLK